RLRVGVRPDGERELLRRRCAVRRADVVLLRHGRERSPAESDDLLIRDRFPGALGRPGADGKSGVWYGSVWLVMRIPLTAAIALVLATAGPTAADNGQLTGNVGPGYS